MVNERIESQTPKLLFGKLKKSYHTELQEFVKVFEAQAHGKAEGVTIKMTCYSGPYTGKIMSDSEIEEVAWFTHADKEKSPSVDKIIFDWLKENDLIN